MTQTEYPQKRRVLLIYTGGTIGMIRNPETGALETFNFEHVRNHVQELKQFDYEIHSYQFDPPIDSSDMQPELWARLVRIIAESYDRFDGFVILHGTDTMAYTASALSFMLENLGKPVILTGSQLPIGMLRTDGKENLITAIELAAACDDKGRARVPEVCVCFGAKLYRGNRVTKCNADYFNAFTSYNFPPLAEAGININYDTTRILTPLPDAPFTPHFQLETSVLALTLFPGLRQDIIEQIFSLPHIHGIVLRTFGSGNAPRREWLTSAIRQATQQGKVVVNITQCQKGCVEMGLYATGRQLMEAGVVGGGDMTVECAVTKLMYLFGRGYDPATVRRLMATPLAGELL